MQAKTVTISGGTGPSAWINVDSKKTSFNLGYAGVLYGASVGLTWKMQYGVSDPNFDRVNTQNLSRSTTTVTVVFASDHGLSAGDCVVVYGAGVPFDGTHTVATAADNVTITYAVANSGLTAPTGTVTIIKIRVFDDATATAKTGNFAGSSTIPCTYARANITAFTAGGIALTVTQGSNI